MSTSIQAIPKYKQQGTQRPFVLAAIMLAMFMSAIEATIVSTAMPSIVSDLGGFRLYSWVFSSYLLMQTATILIYGKLSDLYGRKPVFVIGVIIFLIGSLLCGFAESMEMLILYRFIQGFGAGSVMTIATTIIGDMYTKTERAKIQGYLSSVWGISAILGPALGALFVQYVDWSYVFWMNIPIGIVSLLGVVLFLKEKVEKKKHKIDFNGSFILFITVASLMVVLVEGGTRWSWFSLPVFTLLAISVLGTILFFRQERKVSQPMMPLSIWKSRAITISNIGAFLTGAILLGVSSFLPTFVQGVLEYSPFIAGITLTSMSIGWPIAAIVAGRLLLSIGYQKTSVIGGINLIIGAIFFLFLSPDKGPIWAAFGSIFTGVGMGFTTTAFIVSIQSSVSWQVRGAATASNNFMRQLGGALGAALFGGILNSQFQSYLDKINYSGMVTINSADQLLNKVQRETMNEMELEILQNALTVSLHSVYIAVFGFACLTLLCVIFMPVTEEKP